MDFKKWLLVEGTFDWEATLISREIIKKIKQNISDIEKGIILYHGESVLQYQQSIQFIKLNLPELNIPPIYVFCKDGEVGNVSGSANPKSKLLQIRITLPMQAYPEILNKIIPKLKNTIRHELEHFSQTEDKLKHYVKPEVDFMRYFTHPSEVEAFVVGMNKEAKTARIPFEKVTDEYLSFIKRKYEFRGINSQDLDKIKYTWLHYYKKRFGK